MASTGLIFQSFNFPTLGLIILVFFGTNSILLDVFKTNEKTSSMPGGNFSQVKAF